MSANTVHEEQRIRRLLANLREAYNAGKISKEVHDRLTREYEKQLGIVSSQPSRTFEGRQSSLVGTSGPRIRAIEQARYQRPTGKVRAEIWVAVAALLLLSIVLIIAGTRR